MRRSKSIYNGRARGATAHASNSRCKRACYAGGAAGAWRGVVRGLTLVMCLYVVGCSAESKLRKEGKTPYVRCVAGPEPDARTLRAGPWTFEIKQRVLQVQGPSRPLRIAALSAPGFSGAPGSDALARLRAAEADLLVLLGGVGEGTAAATATVQALASLSMPSLIVLGGRDTWAAHEKAFEDLPPAARIIDGTVLRAIRIGSNTFVPLPGAELGRYAVQAAACGFDQADLESAAQELGARQPGETRWLLSWQAPLTLGGTPGPKSAAGVALGSALVSSFAEKVGATGGLYAWPNDESAAAPARGQLGLVAVPRLYGPRRAASNGALITNTLLVLEVSATGVNVVL
jgi:hypothetical protein